MNDEVGDNSGRVVADKQMVGRRDSYRAQEIGGGMGVYAQLSAPGLQIVSDRVGDLIGEALLVLTMKGLVGLVVWARA